MIRSSGISCPPTARRLHNVAIPSNPLGRSGYSREHGIRHSLRNMQQSSAQSEDHFLAAGLLGDNSRGCRVSRKKHLRCGFPESVRISHGFSRKKRKVQSEHKAGKRWKIGWSTFHGFYAGMQFRWSLVSTTTFQEFEASIFVFVSARG